MVHRPGCIGVAGEGAVRIIMNREFLSNPHLHRLGKKVSDA